MVNSMVNSMVDSMVDSMDEFGILRRVEFAIPDFINIGDILSPKTF